MEVSSTPYTIKTCYIYTDVWKVREKLHEGSYTELTGKTSIFVEKMATYPPKSSTPLSK